MVFSQLKYITSPYCTYEAWMLERQVSQEKFSVGNHSKRVTLLLSWICIPLQNKIHLDLDETDRSLVDLPKKRTSQLSFLLYSSHIRHSKFAFLISHWKIYIHKSICKLIQLSYLVRSLTFRFIRIFLFAFFPIQCNQNEQTDKMWNTNIERPTNRNVKYVKEQD